jgi:hypothetical protein
MLSQYELGKIIHDLTQRTIFLERLLGTDNPGFLKTENLTVYRSLVLPYTSPNKLLFTSIGGEVSDVHMADILYEKANQTTLTDNGDGTVTVGTVQDIGLTSSPTFNNATITGSERIGNKLQLAPMLYSSSPTYKFEMMGSTVPDTILNMRKSDNSSTSSSILLQKSRGTLNFPTNVQDNDILGLMYFSGYDGSQWGTSSLMAGIASEVHTPTQHGTRFEIHTTANGTINTTKKMLIEHNGDTTIYSTTNTTTTSSGALVVNGGVGIMKNLYAGGNFHANGQISANGKLDVGDDLTVYGDAHIYGSIISDTQAQYPSLNLFGTVDSFAMDQGTLTVYGGTTIRKNLLVGSTTILGNLVPLNLSRLNVTINQSFGELFKLQASGNIADFNINSDNSLTVKLATNASHSINLSTTKLSVNHTTATTSSSTGALTVAGGVGIAGSLHVNGDISSGSSSVSQSFTGPCVLTDMLNCYKIGRLVMIDFPYKTGIVTSSTYFTASGVIPTAFRPTKNLRICVFVTDNNIEIVGSCTITTTGDIRVYTGSNGNFTVTGTAGFSLNINYSV